MIKYNWKTRKYEVWVRWIGRNPVMIADFWRYEQAIAYLDVRHVKC